MRITTPNEIKSTILVVDDNKKNLQVLGNILNEVNYKVAMAIDGNSALKLANHLLPDLIILDIMMPGMDGFEVCKILKADEKTKEIPIIFLTAKVELDDVIEGFNLGGADYITKPFKKKELLVRIKNHLDLIQSKRKVEEQAAQLKAANLFKDKLFSIIGHDLRSPLSSLKLTFDLIVAGLISIHDDDFIDTVKSLSKSTEEAYVLLENLLGWAKSESGTLEVAAETINMKEMAESTQRLLKLNLKNKSINFIIDVEDKVLAWADSQMIQTTLRNLVSNATKFTPTNGTITIHAFQEGDKIITNVSDTGVGIPPESLAQLFVARGKIKTYGTNNEPGSGLGLILCHDFIEKNGGELTVTSKLNEGSTFSFSLPCIETRPNS
ncbi:MAG: hybrid sensor histidine kinase/response regulator [Prolixibacteraceae bacterium]|jgi:two-component system sensor histidine kinase/response regulator|nr:hybrid sensor histidine kinase/response regulator [Prolixibacteraceae bacterium]